MTPSVDWTRETDPQIRELRRRAAYVAVFASELGRAVLLDLVAEVGAFDRLGAPNGERQALLEYSAGRRDLALELAELAGVDRARLAIVHVERAEGVAVAEHQLEQETYDGRSDYE